MDRYICYRGAIHEEAKGSNLASKAICSMAKLLLTKIRSMEQKCRGPNYGGRAQHNTRRSSNQTPRCGDGILNCGYIIVSRQLQAVDCDEAGGIVMREIAVGLCAAGGLLSLLSRNSHIQIENQAILHSSF
jgi:hypothetical protein